MYTGRYLAENIFIENYIASRFLRETNLWHELRVILICKIHKDVIVYILRTSNLQMDEVA